MDNYGKYFLQNALWLDDGFCQYYVQDTIWSVQEILDVQTMVFFWPEDTLQWLYQCAEYDSFDTLYRLRDYLAEHGRRSYMLHRMDDRQVLHAAAEELTDNMSRVVVHPTIGWAVQAASHADFPVLPPGVEAEPDLDGQLLELQACLDELVAEQQQQYKQYEADLARMSPEERELFYSRNTGDAVYDTIIDDSWQMIKAAPAVLEKAARAYPGFYKNTLKTLWKIAQTPSRMGILIGQGIATGNYNPLQQEIDSIVTPLAATSEQALEYKSMLTVLFQDEEIYAMLYDFAERYWDATHPVERTRMTASAVSDVLVILILAIFTAGVGAAAKVAAKAGKLGKAAKLLKKITETIKRTAGRHRVLERNLEGGAGTTARTGSVARKGGVPEVESPKIKPDETVVNEYNASGEGVGPKKTSEAKPPLNSNTRFYVKPDGKTLDTKTYSRNSGFRKGVKDKAWNDAVDESTGRVRDPLTGKTMNKDEPWDMGHRPKMEFRKERNNVIEKWLDKDEYTTRKEFLDKMNDPSRYRPELPSSNRSHRAEDLTDDFWE